MLGKASLEEEISFKGGQYEGLEVEKKLIYGSNCQENTPPPRQPICPIEGFENHTVDLLIDPFTRKWNEELINGLFVEEDAELIKSIPLSRTVTEDAFY